MKNQLLTLAGILFCFFTYGQTVNIPDANFKNYLLNNTLININGDSEIQVSEASVFTGKIDCYNKNITSMTGIEAFVALTGLSCDYNNITSLDLSKNIELITLTCFNNQIANLDVSKNILLNYLICTNNQLTNIDVSKNPALKTLNCGINHLTSLDVSKNTVLTSLSCYENELTNLNVSKNIDLMSIDCFKNRLMSLDVSKHQILAYLLCSDNLLTSLDVSKNPALIVLTCSSNLLTSLNIKNGNNTKMISHGYANNPDLTCIQVDNAAYSTTNWISKDSWANYNTNCDYMSVNDVRKSKLKLYPNPVKNNLIIQTEDKLLKAEIYSTSAQLIKTSFFKETNVAGLVKGNYLIRITTDKTVQTEKFIKE